MSNLTTTLLATSSTNTLTTTASAAYSPAYPSAPVASKNKATTAVTTLTATTTTTTTVTLIQYSSPVDTLAQHVSSPGSAQQQVSDINNNLSGCLKANEQNNVKDNEDGDEFSYFNFDCDERAHLKDLKKKYSREGETTLAGN